MASGLSTNMRSPWSSVIALRTIAPATSSTCDDARQQFTAVLAQCRELAALRGHVRALAEVLTTRSGQHPKDWVATRTDDLPGLQAFAAGLEKDWDSVVQGLTTCWNSGPVEGLVKHMKMIKRQMFGRAKLSLRRKRVLLTATCPSGQPAIAGQVRCSTTGA